MGSMSGATAHGLTRLWTRTERWRPWMVTALALGAIATLWLLRGELKDIDWKALGYPGAFTLSFIGSVSMVLPVPGLATICALSVVLSPLALGLIGAVGETLGELSGYAVGYGGNRVLEDRRLYRKVKGWMERRGMLLVFLVSLVPNPLVDVVGIAAGATRLPLPRFMAAVWAGKSIKGVMVAYTCYYGVNTLPWVN